MRFKTMFSAKEFAAIGFFIVLSCTFIWAVMIRPYDYDWVSAGYMQGKIATVLPTQQIYGGHSMKALVKLEDGSNAVVSLPMKPYLIEGAAITLAMMQDSADPAKRQFTYAEP